MGNAEGLGGAQTAFRKLVDFLTKEGHEVGAIAIADSNEGPETHLPLLFNKRVPHSKSLFTKPIALWSAAKAAQRSVPKVFIAVGPAKSASLISKSLPRSTYKVCQDFIYGRNAADPLLRDSIEAFDAIAVQAPSMLAPLGQLNLGAIKLNWLPCFAEAPAPGFRKTRNGDQSHLRLAYFGRLAGNKGFDLLLPAFAEASFPLKVELDIWGTGPEQERLIHLIHSLGIESRVKLRGRYPDGEEGARLMCGYDALVLTSTGLEGLHEPLS